MTEEQREKAKWFKSTRSNGSGACLEIAANFPGIVPVRDSKDPDGPVVVVDRGAWGRFATAVKNDALVAA